jgi:hypothetical protein
MTAFQRSTDPPVPRVSPAEHASADELLADLRKLTHRRLSSPSPAPSSWSDSGGGSSIRAR